MSSVLLPASVLYNNAQRCVTQNAVLIGGLLGATDPKKKKPKMVSSLA